MSLQKLYDDLPRTPEALAQLISTPRGLANLQTRCAAIEMDTLGKDLDEIRRVVYVYQLLCYLALGQLSLVKYFWKRVPAALKKQDQELEAIWKIAQFMWKEEYFHVYPQIREGYKWTPLFIPLLQLVETRFRLRMVELLNKAFSRIGFEQILLYLGAGKEVDAAEWLQQFVQQHELDNWQVNQEAKAVEIAKVEERLNLDSQLLTDLTNYVVFLESNQELQFDKKAQAEGKNK